MLEFSNFRVTLARQQRDKEKEYEAILAGYRALHSKTVPPEQCVIEISTLSMLTNGNFDATAVLNDVAQHFESYFTLPLPARIIVLQGLTRPARLNAEQAALYQAWTPRLIDYARYQAPRDMDQYERQLSTDCVNERCWLLHQRIDFLRRSDEHYDGRQVLQWLQEMAQIYRDCNQAFHEIEVELAILKQYEEMFFLHQLPPDAALFSKMNALLADAYAKAKRLPAATVGGYWIDLAYFSANLDSAGLCSGLDGAVRCNARSDGSQRRSYSDANPKSFRLNNASRNSGLDGSSRYGARSDASSESISLNNAGQWNGLDGTAQGSISRGSSLNNANGWISLDGTDCSGQSDASPKNFNWSNAAQTQDCLNRFLDLQLSPQHLSLNLQQKLSWLLLEFYDKNTFGI